MIYQAEKLSQSLRRTVVGLTGLQKRLFFARPKNFNFLGRGKFKSPLFVALAAILATQFPIADAQAQTGCPGVTGEHTATVALTRKGEHCTVERGAKVEAVGPTATNTRIIYQGNVTQAAGFRITANEVVLVNRGLISGRRSQNTWGQGVAIAGNKAHVVNYGTIKTSNRDAFAILLGTDAYAPELDILGGQVYVDDASSDIIHSFAQDTSAGSSNPGIKLTLGGTLGKAGVKAGFLVTTALAKGRNNFAARRTVIGRRPFPYTHIKRRSKSRQKILQRPFLCSRQSVQVGPIPWQFGFW